jgi:hypothetical protein
LTFIGYSVRFVPNRIALLDLKEVPSDPVGL